MTRHMLAARTPIRFSAFSKTAASYSRCALDRVGSGQIAELAFDFPTGTLHCRCNVDTDEIIIEVVDAASLDYSVIRDEALAGLRGMSVSDAWLMTNDRGYTDALQLRFTDTEGREETRQFEVAASTISLRLVVDQR